MSSNDVAIDLGTANTLIYVRGEGIVLNEPSIIAIRESGGLHGGERIVAVGNEAKRMLGRTPGHTTVVRPLKSGVIADFAVTERMFQDFMRKAQGRRWRRFRQRMLVGIPCGSTHVERRAILEAGHQAGAKKVYLIEEPMAAAMGAGLPVAEPQGSMVLDIGGGTSEVAVISLNGIVYTEALRVAGDTFDEAIRTYVRRNYGAVIGETTAERVKQAIGSAYPTDKISETEVHAHDRSIGRHRRFVLNSNEILEALQETLARIVDAVKKALEQIPPELGADVSERGITLTGGGALLRGMDLLIAEETRIPVRVADDALTCVVRGAGQALEALDQPGVDLFVSP